MKFGESLAIVLADEVQKVEEEVGIIIDARHIVPAAYNTLSKLRLEIKAFDSKWQESYANHYNEVVKLWPQLDPFLVQVQVFKKLLEEMVEDPSMLGDELRSKVPSDGSVDGAGEIGECCKVEASDHGLVESLGKSAPVGEP